jgi:uncharacterized iron-regulated membrane protein
MELTPRASLWRRRFRGFWLTVHLYIALTIGFVFVILGLTGACNVFYRAAVAAGY